MQPIQTKLTQKLNIKSPILAAAMALPGMVDIALEVTKAGGFGFVGSGYELPATIRQQIKTCRQGLGLSDDEKLPIGFGLLGWRLDQLYEDEEQHRQQQQHGEGEVKFKGERWEEKIEAVLEGNSVAIWFAFGKDLGRYVRKVREWDEEKKREEKTLVFIMVNSLEEALKATYEWGADALVVQGNEAGGHGTANSPPMFNFVQSVLSSLSQTSSPSPLIIAAGGITTGPQIASLLTMGVDGVALGTRFLFTPECAWPTMYKSVLLSASSASASSISTLSPSVSSSTTTIRSTAFDKVNPNETTRKGWASVGCDGRAIKNAIVQDDHEELGLEERMKRVEDGKKRGESERVVVWAGVGVGNISKGVVNLKAADVLKELHQETIECLQKARSLLP